MLLNGTVFCIGHKLALTFTLNWMDRHQQYELGETYKHALADTLLFAALPFEANKSSTDEAESRVLWHLFADSAGLPVIVLEDDIVVVG